MGLRRHGAVLVVRVVGYYTRKVALGVRDRVNAAMDDRGAVKVLLDLRSCVSLLSDDEWASLAHELAADPIRADMGILVAEGEMVAAWRRCLTLSRTGRVRLPFETPEQAAMWAEVAATALRPVRPFAPVS